MPDIFVEPTVTAATTPSAPTPAVAIRHAMPATAASAFSAYRENPSNISFQTQEYDEIILLFLRRHLITNLSWILTSLILMLFPVLLISLNAIFPLETLFPGFSLSENLWIIITFFYFLIVATFIFARFIDWFYNISLVTQKRIVDIDYTNLISHDIAITKVELVEDVRYTQMGVAQSFFNYGDVFVQTAGKHANFDFLKVPRPAHVTTVIEELIGRRKH